MFCDLRNRVIQVVVMYKVCTMSLHYNMQKRHKIFKALNEKYVSKFQSI